MFLKSKLIQRSLEMHLNCLNFSACFGTNLGYMAGIQGEGNEKLRSVKDDGRELKGIGEK